MESGDLRIFQAVAREGSITKAAARLGYVQSNVTTRIQQLEAELRTPLFQRHNRGMRTTPNGSTLLDYADKIIALLDEASKVLSDTNEPRGPLRLGSMQTTAAVRLPKLLLEYHLQYPNAVISLTTGTTPQMLEKVLQYELDGAFVSCRIEHPELLARLVFAEEPVIVAATSVSSIEEALRMPVLAFGPGCYYREVLEQWLLSNGSFSGTIMELGTLEAIIGGVAAGLGISLLPKTVVNRAHEEGLIRFLPLAEPLGPTSVYFVTRKDMFISGALRAFMEMIPSAEPLESV